MKKRSDLKYLPFIYVLLGLLALGLRLGLYAAATDDRGLLTAWHPLTMVLFAVTALAAVGAVLMTRFCRIGDARGPVPAVTATAFAVALLYCLLTARAGTSPTITLVHRVLGVTAAMALIAQAIVYLLRKPPYFLLYGLVCAFLCVQMVQFYQLWSEHPQLQDYVFGLGSVLTMVLFVYYRGAAKAGLSAPRAVSAIGLMGIFFSLAAIPQSEEAVFFAASALWLTGELTRLLPLSKQKG